MKRLLSAMLAALFVLTAFGVTAIFGGVISAGAFYDYYVYTSIPGFSIYTDAELAKIQNSYFSAGVNETVDGIGNVVSWTRTGSNSWGGGELYGAFGRNLKQGNHNNSDVTDMPDATWAAKDTIGGKTVMGVLGSEDYMSFAGEDGIVIWFGLNGQPYTGKVSLRLWQIPCAGPFFTGALDADDGDHNADELNEYGNGFQYCSRSIQTDENGYAHFDFKTDFYQADWWSVDDEGNPQQGDLYKNGTPNYMPVPKSKIALISGFSFGFDNTSVGDKISIGDIKSYHDSRIHLDELEELMMQYDVLDPEAYTEDSYSAATDAYLVAYEVMNDPAPGENYSQQQIDDFAYALKVALRELKPMFKAKSGNVTFNGFDVLTDDDIDEINDGGYSYDAALLDDDVVPEGEAAQSVCIIGQAFDGDPSYGWSQFSTAKYNDDGEIVAVNNVFGAENAGEAAGIRFWIKYADEYVPAPTNMIIGVGSSTDGVYFECDPDSVELPDREGYVGVAWNAFYDYENDEEIFDYVGSLDYITIRIEECYQKTYYVSDLHAFDWSINSANFTAMDERIISAQDYLSTLNKDEWSVRSWQRAEQSIEDARALHEAYAVTQQEVDKATTYISTCLSRLTPAWDTATQEEIDALEAAYYGALTYWHGNYTGRSFADMRAVLDEVSEYIADELGSAVCREFTTMINDAVAALVPITHGGTVAPTQATDSTGKAVTVKLFSTEDFSSSRDLNRANGHRRDNVRYDLVSSADGLTLPAKALKMTAQTDLSSKHTDQHGALQFKLFNSFGQPITLDVTTEDGNKIGGSIGDLSGSAGIRVWVGVNDVRLAQNAFFRFGVSNCQEGPLFEKHAVNIPFPASGSGWLYIPWDAFDYYDDWTKGVDINLAEIRFWIVRVDGEVPQGLEVYTSSISAYTDQVPATNATPVITGVADGETVDVAGGSVVPKWDIGTATLNGKLYVSGTPITQNDEYTLTVTNGDKQTSVNFTVTGGAAADKLPIVTGVADGGVYEEPVTINWDVGTATLNGEAFEKGTEVSEPGSYVLEVVNGTKSVSVRFTINGTTPPPPPVKKGDFNDNGKIEVDDALAALRIAARLAEATPEAIAIGDIDGNGAIEVNDALSILRVAAKLASEESLG